jgi:peptidoglycan/LPS O-acetylase OafA/YrhL
VSTNISRWSGLADWTSRNLDGLVLLLILLVVGGFAGAASFTHVHDWTMDNSPEATGDWFGWANAVISELVPVASLLVMRRRRRRGQSIAYPVFLLVVALALSVTAQLAVAKPGFWGGVVSVIPALAFAALAKLIIGKPTDEHAEPVPPGNPATLTDVVMLGELVPAQDVSSSNGQRDTAGLIGTVTR